VGKAFTIYAAISKANIDVKKRTVTGIAQVEDHQPDTQGDIVDFGASKRAFSAWPGNIREMHGNKAVGRSVSWWADPVRKRIYVRARISEGAEDTWKKVLDGTLTGFSIGGQQLAAKREVDKSTGNPVNRITAYRLNELSLVDSPANPHCVITAIHKRKNGVLEATNVLGNIQQGARMELKAVATEVRNLTKGVDSGEEFLLIKKSDLDAKRSDGLLVLSKSAKVVPIKKDDMDGMADAAEADPGASNDMGNIDLEDHATNAANMHRDLCKMAGIDDHVGHYEDATEGDDDAQDMDDDGIGDQGADDGQIQMSRRTGSLRKRRAMRNRRKSEAEIQKRIDKAVGDATKTLAAKVDELTKSLGGGAAVAPRKGAEGEAGTPISKTVGDVVGENGEKLEKGSGARYRELAKRLGELNTEKDGFIAKMNSRVRLSNDEIVRKDQVLRELTRVEVEMSELASNAQAVA
jgi:hypothetical protein